ncbi:MAG: hypothetical protein H3C34_06175 [Caldilineaceae bacterium]|nr:hypothetical protein [Caldilineaceae bacterium]
MTLDEFRASLDAGAAPAGLKPALQALWHAAKGNWDKAHSITQSGSPELDWVHAYLHRVEGDLPNARYWYRRAGRPEATVSLEEEWAALAEALLASN